MSGFILLSLLYFVIGGVLGVAHARSIADGERMFQQTGERARPTALFLFRFALVLVAFGVFWKAGRVPFATALGGFFLAKLLVAALGRRR